MARVENCKEYAPAVTACDPNGCWTSEGTRLPRMGPQLMGPNGLCTAQGGFAYCP